MLIIGLDSRIALSDSSLMSSSILAAALSLVSTVAVGMADTSLGLPLSRIGLVTSDVVALRRCFRMLLLLLCFLSPLVSVLSLSLKTRSRERMEEGVDGVGDVVTDVMSFGSEDIRAGGNVDAMFTPAGATIPVRSA